MQPWTLEFDRGTLVVRGPGPDALPPGLRWDDRIQAARGHASAYAPLVRGLHEAGLPWHDAARAYERLDDLPHDLQGRTPRDYQQAAVDAWDRAGRRGIVVLPTGSGKSLVAELAIARARRSTLVVAPTLDLVAQWANVLERAFHRPIGLLGGGRHEPRTLTVSTYDSAFLHAEHLGARFGLVVFDEVHHLPSPGHRQIAEMLLAPFRLGLSATPERDDGLDADLPELVGPVVYRRGIRELAGQVLADYRTVTVEVELDPDEAEAYARARAAYTSFVRSRRIRIGGPRGWNRFLQLAARSPAGRAALRGHRESRRIMHGARGKLDALEMILQRHPEGRVIVFTHDNDTVHRVSLAFGIPCITHETGVAERKTILAGLRDGRWRAVVTARVLNEGVDLPEVDVGVVLSGTATVREHVQRLGRLLRPRPGKQAVLYEVITVGTAEERASQRRRRHDAWR